MNSTRGLLAGVCAALALGLAPSGAAAFDSGSTGSDGAFNPTVDTELTLPADGVFNFTDVDIPAGVTVTFARNTPNTPVVILASGNVTIDGTLDVSGSDAAPTGAAGDGNQGDDGLPGLGGPGGFDGGRGGVAGDIASGDGLGPGAGLGNRKQDCAGAGGGFGIAGDNVSNSGSATGCVTATNGAGGSTYGTAALLPLIGGSGGGGGAGGSALGGGGGGGGGGAVLIAASGTVTVNGSILAEGGSGAATAGGGAGGGGGGGSGGAVRIVATTIDGNGSILADGESGGTSPLGSRHAGGDGGDGRIRLESETFLRTAGTTPGFTFGAPDDLFVPGLPALRITTVDGVAAPTNPTGSADIVLPQDTLNPVTVEFETSGVPAGNTVTLTVTPAAGDAVSAVSNALVGDETSATASVAVDLPDGPSVLQATVSFTVVASVGDALRHFARGERVERIVLAATPGGGSQTTFVSVSGRRYVWPSSALLTSAN